MLFPGLKADEVSSIQIQPRGQFEIRVERTTNGAWLLTRPIAYPVQSAAVDNLLQSLVNLPVQLHISPGQLKGGGRNASTNYGFDDPLSVIVLNQGGDERQLKLGLATAPGGQIYAQVLGDGGVEVVDSTFLKSLPGKADDWRDPTFANLKGVPFDALAVASGDKSVLEFQRDATNRLWRMVRPDQTRANSSRIDALLKNLQSAQIVSFATDDPSADLDRFGLKPPEFELKFKQGTNQLFSLQFGKSPATDTNLIYARSNGQSTIVLLPRPLVAEWKGESETFRERHLANFVESNLPDTVEVTGQESNENFTVQWNTNGVIKVTDAENHAFPADRNSMILFFSMLAGLEVKTQPDGRVAYKGVVNETDWGPIYGLAPPARRYVFKQTGGTNATNVPAVVVAQLDFGLKEKRVFARRSDLAYESAVYEIREEDFRRLPTNGFQLRERRVWAFDATNVTNLKIMMNAKTWRYDHARQGHWTIAEGNDSMGDGDHLTMEEAVGTLGELQAQSWVARGEDARATYGFTNNGPQISVEVKLGGKSKTYTMEFGNVSPNKLLYAAVQLDGQTWIFEVPDKMMRQIADWLRFRERE
jgi:hypothetical protein